MMADEITAVGSAERTQKPPVREAGGKPSMSIYLTGPRMDRPPKGKHRPLGRPGAGSDTKLHSSFFEKYAEQNIWQ
ncbi:hypothetical protein [Hydrogenispora ethanolica]|uniref:hypothetical protein n=1 Tax=Hydrogenispora ethanolica TaxID=1082276 RepID=UPI0010530919|nr:hypothetical protein [Hydrogenispora ethanolica]